MSFDLRRLRHFVAVGEEGGVSRGAERLGMQQAPLSQSIAALERDLGVALFRRLPRGMALTEAGKVLFREAKAVLARLEQARLSTLRAARGEQGRLVVGFTNSAPFHALVPRAIRDFSRSRPGVSLGMEEGVTAELVDGLRTERIDVAFLRTDVGRMDGLSAKLLLSEPFIAALPATHVLARDPGKIRLRDLSRETFVIYRRLAGPGLHDAILSACRAAGFSPISIVDAPRMVATLNLVASDLGVALVPSSLRRMKLDNVAYRELVGGSNPQAPLFLTRRKGDHSAIVRYFSEIAAALAKQGVS